MPRISKVVELEEKKLNITQFFAGAMDENEKEVFIYIKKIPYKEMLKINTQMYYVSNSLSKIREDYKYKATKIGLELFKKQKELESEDNEKLKESIGKEISEINNKLIELDENEKKEIKKALDEMNEEELQKDNDRLMNYYKILFELGINSKKHNFFDENKVILDLPVEFWLCKSKELIEYISRSIISFASEGCLGELKEMK